MQESDGLTKTKWNWERD